MADYSLGNKVTESVSLDNLIKADEAMHKNSSSQNNSNGAKNDANDAKKKQSTNEKVSKAYQKAKIAEANVYSNINTTMAILDKLPAFADVITDVLSTNSLSFTISPMYYLLKLLKVIGVTEKDLQNFLVDLLVVVLPEVEIGVKAALLSNIKSTISCSSDPRIPNQLRQQLYESYAVDLKYQFSTYTGQISETSERGILIDVDSIDPEGMLAYSPYSKEGKDEYFGVIDGDTDITSYSNGSSRLTTTGNVSKTKSKWELARAEDKDAFLWFVLHVARFAAPLEAVFSGNNVTICGNKYFDSTAKYNNSISGYSSSIFSPLKLVITSSTASSSISVGTTIVDKNARQSEISLCYSTELNEDETRVVRNNFIPVSSNYGSADWYVDTSDYYSYNLGYKKSKPKTIYDYEKQKAICNIQFMQPTDYSTTYIGGSTQKFRFTILPKPYVYLPYLDESIWNSKRILFDADGNPDKNGKFSLPTEKKNTSGTPYVRNTFISPFSESLGVKKALEDSSFDNNLGKTIDAISNNTWDNDHKNDINYVKEQIISGYSASVIEAMILVIQSTEKQETNKDIINVYEKCIAVLKECFNKKLSQEGNNTNDFKEYTKIRVGEDSDKCALWINKKTGEYHLGSWKSPYIKNGDYAKHLQQCYNGLTIYEFNYDFIMGMRLFSPKVVVARLLKALTNWRTSVGASFSITKDQNKYDYAGNKQAILSIVREIVESDDEEIDDCFFNFDNTKEAEMLDEAEEKRYHQQPYLNDKNSTIDLTDAFEILNQYSETATKEEQKTIISNTISAATAKVNTNRNVYAKQDSKNIKFNFLTNMLTELTAILIESILTPKVMLLLAVNKEIMGTGGETFNSKELMLAMKGVIRAVIKEIKELIMKKILDYILDYLGPLAAELLAKYSAEQFAVYQAILKDLLNLFRTGKMLYNQINSALSSFFAQFKSKSSGTDYDLPTVLDNVDYADIIKTNDNDTEKPVSSNNC